MKNYSLALLLNILLLAILAANSTHTNYPLVAAQTVPRIFVDPPVIRDTSKGIGSTFTVDIGITDVENLYGWQANITYYPDVVNTTEASITEGNFLQDFASTTFLKAVNNTAGYLLVSCSFFPPYPSDGAYGDGTLASITFTVRAENQVTPLKFGDKTKLRTFVNGSIAPIENFKTGDGWFDNREQGFNIPPIARFSIYPSIVNVSDYVLFDASTSYDPDGFIVSYFWNFGDGTTELHLRDINLTTTAHHAYELPGTYVANLTVTDNNGGSGSSQGTVYVRTMLTISMNPENGTVGTIVQITGINATSNSAVDIFWGPSTYYVWPPYYYSSFSLIGTVLADSAGEFVFSFQVPPSTMGIHPVMARDVMSGEDDIKYFQVQPSISIDPTSGPVGTKITVKGTGFPYSQYGPVGYVMFDDQNYGYVSADINGNAQAVINAPFASPGPHSVKAMLPYYYGVTTTEATFNIVDTTVLDVTAEVGAFYFKGETAKFTVLTAFKGTPVDVTSLEAELTLPNGTTISLVPKWVTTGLYTIDYPINGKGSITGTYTLIVKANYATDTTAANGTTLATFMVKPTWERDAPKIAAFSITSIGLVSAMIVLWRKEKKKFLP